jgi:peroxiredoxin
MMKKAILFFSFVLIFFLVFHNFLYASGKTPLKGDVFPDITLTVSEKTLENDYLGLTPKGSFRISGIKADVLIIEIYSMYCPYCQKEAPSVNELYQIISKSEDIKNKVKIIGIGAGNTPFEIDVFRNQYSIQFPLFSDETFKIHKAIGEVRTPYFFVVKKNTDGSNTLIYSKVGSIQDPGQFLDIILKEAGLR